jgi:hypothetical protein
MRLLSPAPGRSTTLDASGDRVGLSWLVTVRWTTLLAVFGTVMAWLSGLHQ